MDTGLVVTIGIFAIVGLFGLAVLFDRRKIKKEKADTYAGMSPAEIWDKHIDKLNTQGA